LDVNLRLKGIVSVVLARSTRTGVVLPNTEGSMAREQVVELKRTVATKKGSPNTVEMRLANSEQEIAEEPSTIFVS
jgi:hypothetical protein